ncbi:hypothetical protein [Blastococcus litoris]|uniref:hypothetical protein n=1 Tax=Blastococcus litoris TaxID=2171622 RepID=UPI0013DEC95D|nr:hypothetical protein [Blastococcus litoris]
MPRSIGPLVLVPGAVVLAGCASTEAAEVERVATSFEDTGGRAAERCDLLAPATRAALEDSGSAACADVVADLPLGGGTVESVEVWGGQAQVRLSGDTLFLTQTGSGWRITAAVCRPRAEAPYDCEVDGP